MDGKDLAGVIFVIVFLPLIIVLTALCLWCNCHPRSGRNCQKPTPSRTTEIQLPYFNSPPFDERISLHIPNHHPTTVPRDMRRTNMSPASLNTLHEFTRTIQHISFLLGSRDDSSYEMSCMTDSISRLRWLDRSHLIRPMPT